jgi:fructokinase
MSLDNRDSQKNRNVEAAGALMAVAIGEALFDCFSDRVVLGGAPLNFIVHLKQLLRFRCEAYVVTCIGNDDLGAELSRQLEDRQIRRDFTQVDAQQPTGKVTVQVNASGDPSYDIAENAAWDFIAYDERLHWLAEHCDVVCFGTLAQRSPVSRGTILEFVRNASSAIRLLDVNLRQHYFSREILVSSIAAANVVKLNEGELAEIVNVLDVSVHNSASDDDRIQALFERFDLSLLALTRGSRGTVLYTQLGRREAEPVFIPKRMNADSVGAGDACCAGLACGLLLDWPLEATLQFANRMGAYVASQPGATPRLPASIIEHMDLPQVQARSDNGL